jgi:hypothetical protein
VIRGTKDNGVRFHEIGGNLDTKEIGWKYVDLMKLFKMAASRDQAN